VSAERAYLLSAVFPPRGEAEALASLAELARLAESAGALVAGQALQFRRAPDPALYLGSGKARELKAALAAAGASLALVDDELKPSQARNLERELGARVVDRTQLILDIFAQRARTREGKLQVELAQLEYLLPRLVGSSEALSRLGGGIGTRGPGETKLEADRRRLRDRIVQLKLEIAEVARTRGLHRAARRSRQAVSISLVGYTNAGKSSLFNALTGAGVLVQDRLFATLDPTTRPLPGSSAGRPILLSDTVGFVRRLPHALVAAFRATLEEVAGADLLLHVADAASPELASQVATVEQVLMDVQAELGVEPRPVLLALNKADLLSGAKQRRLLKERPGALLVSAREGLGLPGLAQALAARAAGGGREAWLSLPASQAWLLEKHFDSLQVHRRAWSGGMLKAEVLLLQEVPDLEPYMTKAPRDRRR
jgi:GTP-binding protein HflX